MIYILVIERLRQKEIGGQILVFVAGEVCLDHQVFRETKCFQLEKMYIKIHILKLVIHIHSNPVVTNPDKPISQL